MPKTSDANEKIRAVLREYLALESQRASVAEGSRPAVLRGAARSAWLRRARGRLDELRWRLVALAITRRVP